MNDEKMTKRTRLPHQVFMNQIRQGLAEGIFLHVFGYGDEDMPTDGPPDLYPCDFYCNPEQQVLFAILDDFTQLQRMTVQHIFDMALEYRTVPQEQYNAAALKKMEMWKSFGTFTVPIRHDRYKYIHEKQGREKAIEQLRADLSGIKSKHKKRVFQYDKMKTLKVALAAYVAKDELGDVASSRDVARVFLGYELKASLISDEISKVKTTSNNIIRTYLKRLELNRFLLFAGKYCWYLPNRGAVQVYEDVVFDKPFSEIKLQIR